MGFITNKTLARRTFLRGVGATVALPLLESMMPAVGSVARAAQLSPTRFTGISFHTARRRATGCRAVSATSSCRTFTSRSRRSGTSS